MSKKVLILNGSPRAKGNTASLIASFTEGAKTAGHEVTCFNVHQMNINPCISCYCGGKNPEHPCTQKDDMEKIYPAYIEADIICLASPLYYWSISGELKCTIDRLFAVPESYPNYAAPSKESTLLMVAGGNEFDAVINWYDYFVKNQNWTDKGKVLCDGVVYEGDINDNVKLEDAYNLGKSL